MSLIEKLSGLERLGKDWKMVRVRGLILLAAGGLIVFASVFNPSGSILHGKELAWLPLAGLVILLVGLMESLDAYMATDLSRFVLHLQAGVFDVVAGSLLAFSPSAKVEQFSLLLVAYLVVKAVLRANLVLASDFPNRQSLLVGAAASVFMGLTVWSWLPETPGWFMSLCLGIDLCLRGWSHAVFAAWLKAQLPPAAGVDEQTEAGKPKLTD